MRRLHRVVLSPGVAATLQRWAKETPDDPRSRWAQRRRTLTLRRVKDALVETHGGFERCAYCEHNEARTIDHFEPISRAPERTFDWTNLLLSCDICNGNKGDGFVGPGGELPVDPLAEEPAEHLVLMPSGAVDTRTRRGEWTAALLRIGPRLQDERRTAWTARVTLAVDYHRHKQAGDDDSAADCLDAFRALQFRSMERTLRELAEDPVLGPVVFRQLHPHLQAALRARPELFHP